MKAMKIKRLIFLLSICFIINSCNEKVLNKGNSSIINEDVAIGIKEYYFRNRYALSNEFILKITSDKVQDTLVLSISYELGLSSIIKKMPNIYDYLDSIPYMYYTGDEDVYKLNNDSIAFQNFISQVFEIQYLKYVIKKANFPPPPTGVCEVARFFVYSNKLMRKEYDNNLLKKVYEIKDGKKTTGNKKLDSLLNIK